MRSRCCVKVVYCLCMCWAHCDPIVLAEKKKKTKCFANKKTLNAVGKQTKPKLIGIHKDKKFL